MHLELQSVSNFLAYLVKLARPQINQEELELFQLGVVQVLRKKYKDRWFPEEPLKCSGSRGIRINGNMDPKIWQAGEYCGWSRNFIDAMFPSELYIWVDPLEVSYRIGDGILPIVYLYKGEATAWTPHPKFETTLSKPHEVGRPLSDYGYKCIVKECIDDFSKEKFTPYLHEELKYQQQLEDNCFLLCNKCDNVLIHFSSKNVSKIISKHEVVLSTKMYLQYCIKQELRQFKNYKEQGWCERFIKVKELSFATNDESNIFKNIGICTRRPNYNSINYELHLLTCSKCLTQPFGVYENENSKRTVIYIFMDDDVKLCKNI